MPETEEELGIMTEETTLIEDNLYLNVSKLKNKISENYRYLKIKIGENLFIYTKISLEAVNNNGENILVRTLNDKSLKW